MKMKKETGRDFDEVEVIKKILQDQRHKGKGGYEPPKFNRIKLLIEKHFLKKNETNLTGGLFDTFKKELEALELGKEDIFLDLVHYFADIFWTATMKTTKKPLHTSRDFALKIYANAFAEMLNDLKEPIKSGKLSIRKVDFIMFLAGIADGPYDYKSISERMLSFAGSDETVLITGETGTGKELHAKAIHYLSPRSKKKFSAVNCAGIPETLLESVLFGHEKGSFTGADQRKIGMLEDVGEGTLFLDEIGDMALALQAKMLRVLQSGDYRRVGGTEVLQFQGRVIAATNRDLRAEIEETPPKFRTDLYYRLNVLPIKLPSFYELSLYEKRNAILYKLRNIMHSKTDKPGNWIEMSHLSGSGGSISVIVPDGKLREVDHPMFSESENPYISEEAMQLLLHYTFPGNYRELDNIIRRAYILAGGKKIEADLIRNEVMEIKKDKPQEVGIEETGDNTIRLMDTIKYANKARADILRRRIESLYRSGQDLKGALASEGMTMDKDYLNFYHKIETIIGKGEIGKIRRECKLKK
jgi:transcriptional regulator with AAA-type ATPase domain